MDVARDFVAPDQLTRVVRAAFGGHRRLRGLDRLRGGSKKGVYRLRFDDGSTAVLYVWDAAENYWPAAPGGPTDDSADPFTEASGLDLFLAANSTLVELGVRTPALYWSDDSRTLHRADVALVEDVPGGTLEALLAADPAAAAGTMADLAASLELMRAHIGPRPGKLARIGDAPDRLAEPTGAGNATDRPTEPTRAGNATDRPTEPSRAGDGPDRPARPTRAGGGPGRPAEHVVLRRALDDLAAAAGRVPRLAAVRDQLAAVVEDLAAAVPPRGPRYSLIHGELGPDHVLVDERGRAAVIDIEGLMFFDVEWEHTFLQLRFGEHYHWLGAAGLDPQRLRFYRLAMHLSLVAGPLRLLDGDFPDRAFMHRVAAQHTDLALRFLG